MVRQALGRGPEWELAVDESRESVDGWIWQRD